MQTNRNTIQKLGSRPKQGSGLGGADYSDICIIREPGRLGLFSDLNVYSL